MLRIGEQLTGVTAVQSKLFSYVPEQVWNDDLRFMQFCVTNPTNQFCTQGGSTKVAGWVPITSEATAQTDIGISSSGGGVSNCSVQNTEVHFLRFGVSETVMADSHGFRTHHRMSPDVSFSPLRTFPATYSVHRSRNFRPPNTASTCASGIYHRC